MNKDIILFMYPFQIRKIQKRAHTVICIHQHTAKNEADWQIKH